MAEDGEEEKGEEEEGTQWATAKKRQKFVRQLLVALKSKKSNDLPTSNNFK